MLFEYGDIENGYASLHGRDHDGKVVFDLLDNQTMRVRAHTLPTAHRLAQVALEASRWRRRQTAKANG